MAADVGGLIADIGLNVAGLRKDIGKSNQELQRGTNRMNRHLGKLRKGIDRTIGGFKGLAAIVGAGMLVRGISRTAEGLEEINRQAQSLGAGRGTIQALTFTFARFGLQSNDVSDALGTLSDRAQDAKDGMQSFQDDFALVGITVDDLRGKKPGELFELMAEKVAQIEDPTRRTAAVVRIFGDDLGRRLLPLLLQGAEGLDKHAKAAREAGAVMSNELVKSGDKAAKTFRELRETIDAQFNRAVAENADALQAIAGALIDIASVSGKVLGFFTDLGKAIGTTTAQLTGAGSTTPFEDEIKAAEERLRKLESITFKNDEVRKRIEQTRAAIERLKKAQLDLLTSVGGGSGKDRPTGAESGGVSVGGGGGQDTDTPSFEGATALIGGSRSPAGGPMLAAEAYRRLGGEVVKADKKIEELTDSQREMKRATDQLGFTFTSAFEDAIIQGNKLRDVMRGLIQDIARIALRTAVTKPLGNALASSIGAMFGGGQQPATSADGNVFTRPGLTTISERGHPEAVLPLERSGGKLGVRASGGGGGVVQNITNNIDARGADKAAIVRIERTVEMINRSIEQRAIAAVGEARARG